MWGLLKGVSIDYYKREARVLHRERGGGWGRGGRGAAWAYLKITKAF